MTLYGIRLNPHDCQACRGRGEVPVYGRVGEGILYYTVCPECKGTACKQRCTQRVVFAGLDEDESGLCGKLLPCLDHSQQRAGNRERE